jgi:hypothetical protein
MMLVDTSIFVSMFRDKSGRRRQRFRNFIRGRDYALTRFTQLELLRGCGSEEQWEDLYDFLDAQDYAEADKTTWSDAARINFDLRRNGLTVGSILDCCIAQLALQHKMLLVHNDGDFELIARVRPLRERRLDIQA